MMEQFCLNFSIFSFLQLKVVNSNSALEYEDIKVININPEIVQNGLMFDTEEDNVYVMSKRQVSI